MVRLRLLRLFLLFGIALSLMAEGEFKYLKLQGNKALSDKEIYTALGLETPSWYEFWKEKLPKVNIKIINSLQESLGFFYRSEGFYHAKVTKKEQNNTVIFHIQEGKPAHIESIEIQSPISIRKWITFKKGERFRAVKFTKVKKKIKENMLNKGFCNFDLNAKAYVDIHKNSVALRYQLDPKNLCYFGKIEIHTPKDIPKKVIASRLLYHTGDQYSLDKINKSYSTISGLEAFDGVQINFHKQRNIVASKISLYPKQKPTRREIGVGYETNYGPKAFLHWSRKNFQGGAKKLSFNLKYSKMEKYIKNEIFWPAFLKIPYLHNYYLDFKNEFSYSKLTFDNFEEKKIANKIHFLKDQDTFSIDLGLGLEDITITKFKDVCNISEGNFLMFYPFGHIVFDFRDSKIDPTKGVYFSQYAEAGLKYILSHSTYLKSITEARLILSKESFTLALKGRFGFIKEFQNKLPESKLFYAGGAFSNRAYSYNSLGAFDASCGDVGGRTLVDSSVELSHPIYHNFAMALFLDSTLITSNTLSFNLDFKESIGTGIRYKTPIGPVKFDIGFSLEDHSQYAIHFQIGQSF